MTAKKLSAAMQRALVELKTSQSPLPPGPTRAALMRRGLVFSMESLYAGKLTLEGVIARYRLLRRQQ